MRGMRQYLRVAESDNIGKPDKKFNHWKYLKQAFPELWPKGQIWMKAQIVLSVVFLLVANALKVATPIWLGKAIDSLTSGGSFVVPIICYCAFRLLSDVFSQLREVMFAAVSAHAERTMSLKVFSHLQRLSLRYHLNRETGKVLRSVSRGAQAFSTVIRVIGFQLGPVLVELVLVCFYLLVRFSFWFAVIITISIFFYCVFTFLSTEYRSKLQRKMNEKDNEFNQKATDALLNFETVKYFNGEEHEESRYDSALQEYKDANIIVQRSMAAVNSGQNFFIFTGVLGALIYAGYKIDEGEMSVGDFVLINAFILQLYQPLNFLGWYYRSIKQAMVDVELIFGLLEEDVEVADVPGAIHLSVQKGEVVFDDVKFQYSPDLPEVLKGISFTVTPGSTLALVGSSGAGKSTIMRLLYRFYDTTGGSVRVDGHDIKTVTQRSLRQNIGIVPQDCVLFNDTIGYNIGYGIVGRSKWPTDEELETAARQAQILDFIQAQPTGMETKVGERGLRLSGGEKQRVAIARALLKNSPIMCFDEATSSLDSKTEKQIQETLRTVAEGRTTLIIAHRLSTIMDADRIVVLKDGYIAETGTHQELLALKGEYREMWMKQLETAEEARRGLNGTDGFDSPTESGAPNGSASPASKHQRANGHHSGRGRGMRGGRGRSSEDTSSIGI